MLWSRVSRGSVFCFKSERLSGHQWLHRRPPAVAMPNDRVKDSVPDCIWESRESSESMDISLLLRICMYTQICISYIYIYTWHDICFRYSMSVVHRNSTYIMPSSSLLMHIGKGKSYISTGKNSVAGTLIPISTPPSTCLMTFGRIWSDFMQWDEWRFAQNRLLTASQMTFSAHSTNLQDVLGARRWRIIHHVLN